MGNQKECFFSVKEGAGCTGINFFSKLRGARFLNFIKEIKTNLVAAAKFAKATLLEAAFHRFSLNQGIFDITITPESSHSSIHSWTGIDIPNCSFYPPSHLPHVRQVKPRVKPWMSATKNGGSANMYGGNTKKIMLQ